MEDKTLKMTTNDSIFISSGVDCTEEFEVINTHPACNLRSIL